MIKTWPHFDLHARLKGLEPFEELTALDLGCGAYNSDVAQQVLEIPWKHLRAVDGYKEDADEAARKIALINMKYEVALEDVTKLKGYADKSYDVVMAFDVLEHLHKQDGEAWLDELVRIARKRVVLMLPIEPKGWHRIDPSMDTNPLQTHLSHWEPHELGQRGFMVERISDVHRGIVRNKDGEEHEEGFDAMWAVRNLENN